MGTGTGRVRPGASPHFPGMPRTERPWSGPLWISVRLGRRYHEGSPHPTEPSEVPQPMPMICRLRALGLAALLLDSPRSAIAEDLSADRKAALDRISADSLRGHLSFLASD